jgi:Tol biopolymer transport system component
VKVLDFGLAKVIEPGSRRNSGSDGGSAKLTQSPTITTPAMTQAGLIMGTAAYMSPEQARGRPVDRRADIWAFGCVLYEMLTGRTAFARATISDSIAAVLEHEPPWAALPGTTPASIRKLLQRCLEKDPRSRLRDIGDARIELVDAQATTGDGSLSSIKAGGRRFAWVTAAVALAAVSAVGWLALTSGNTPVLESRLEITTPPTNDPLSFAISPDGRQVVFAALADGRSNLWLRALDGPTPRLLAGTAGAQEPFWSPTSRSIGFFADQRLKRIDLDTGLVQTLADAPAGRGGTWNVDDVVLFAPNVTGSIMRVSAAGGEEVSPATSLGDQQGSHRYPHFLPDGRTFTFHTQGAPETSGIYIGFLDERPAKRLAPADTSGVYVPPGWLLYSEQGTLVARAFDVAAGALTGPPIRVAEQVGDVLNRAGGFSVSASGLIAYRTTPVAGSTTTNLTWYARSGTMLGIVGEPDRYAYREPRVSPIGLEIAVSRPEKSGASLWLLDGARAARFTFGDALDSFAAWAPDGNSLAYTRNRGGSLNVYVQKKGNPAKPELLLDAPENEAPTSWSTNGRFLLYNRADRLTGMDILWLPMQGNRKPTPFLNTSFQEHGGQFSPNGRWVAYQSNESGRYEIYVRSFPDGEHQTLISVAGGVSVRWSRDGRELFYLAPDGTLMAAPVAIQAGVPKIGSPVALFRTAIVGGGTPRIGTDFEYDIAPDGRFLINVSSVPAPAITIIQNWSAQPH